MPKNRNAPGMSRGVGKDDLAGRSRNYLHRPDPDADQVPLFTAVPANQRWWRVKAVSCNGDVALFPHLFANRLEALGAAVMVAHRRGARVLP